MITMVTLQAEAVRVVAPEHRVLDYPHLLTGDVVTVQEAEVLVLRRSVLVRDSDALYGHALAWLSEHHVTLLTSYQERDEWMAACRSVVSVYLLTDQ